MNDSMLLLGIEEYAQELVAEVAFISTTYLKNQTVQSPDKSKKFVIEIPEDYLGKPVILTDDIHFELCHITSQKHPKR